MTVEFPPPASFYYSTTEATHSYVSKGGGASARAVAIEVPSDAIARFGAVSSVLVPHGYFGTGVTVLFFFCICGFFPVWASVALSIVRVRALWGFLSNVVFGYRQVFNSKYFRMCRRNVAFPFFREGLYIGVGNMVSHFLWHSKYGLFSLHGELLVFGVIRRVGFVLYIYANHVGEDDERYFTPFYLGRVHPMGLIAIVSWFSGPTTRVALVSIVVVVCVVCPHVYRVVHTGVHVMMKRVRGSIFSGSVSPTILTSGHAISLRQDVRVKSQVVIVPSGSRCVVVQFFHAGVAMHAYVLVVVRQAPL